MVGKLQESPEIIETNKMIPPLEFKATETSIIIRNFCSVLYLESTL